MPMQLTLNDPGEAVHDPRLSDEANAALTREIHAVLESDAIHGAPGGPEWRPRQRSGRKHSRLLAAAVDARIVIVPVALMFIVVAVIGLVGDTYAVAGIAFALLILGVTMVAEQIVSMTREVEHVSPETAAMLEDEGIVDPDRLFGDLLHARRTH